MRRLILALVPMLLLLLAGCEKYALNRQMDELCKKDGGVKIFEAVTLPSSRFGKYGELLPILPWAKDRSFSEQILGSDYQIISLRTPIKDGKPFGKFLSEGRLIRNIQRIARNSDGKILGESIWYSRTGGEFTPFGMPSTTECPSPQKDLLRSVFLNGGNHE